MESFMEKRQLTLDEVQDVIQKLDTYLSDLKVRWDQENPGGQSWWKIPKNYLLSSTLFIIEILDELIIFVETIIPLGEDKKAAVITITSKLFDYIVVQAFPFWLRPFAPIVKDIVVNIIVEKLIDYIVEKYNSGFWNMEATNGKES